MHSRAGFQLQVALVLGVLIVAGCAAATPPATGVQPLPPELTPVELSTVDAINKIRLDAGLEALLFSTRLSQVARSHSLFQARTGRSGHTGEGGTSAAERAIASGIAYEALAENVAMNYGYSDPIATAVAAWMDSPNHRRNILSSTYTQTGVGIAVSPDGKTYFTQMFLRHAVTR